MRGLTEFAYILLIIALVIAGVQWMLLRFTHWTIALGATAFLSFIIAALYVQLKHATPNGGSSGPGFGEFILPTLVVFTVLFIGLLLVGYSTQTKLPKIAYVLSFSSVALFGIVSYGYQEVKNMSFYYDLYSNCELEIVNEAGSTSSLEEIRFKDSSSGIYSPIKASTTASVSSMVRFADKISFVSHSASSDLLVEQEFPFDYSLCKEIAHRGASLFFWVETRRILPIKIVLLPDKKADLYLDGIFIEQYQFSDSDSLKAN